MFQKWETKWETSNGTFQVTFLYEYQIFCFHFQYSVMYYVKYTINNCSCSFWLILIKKRKDEECLLETLNVSHTIEVIVK